MFSDYVERAMRHAHYEQIEDGTYFGDIVIFQGSMAFGLMDTRKQSARKSSEVP